MKAAYAPGGDESETQSVASFEGTDIVFTNSGNRPIAVIDGQAVLERSHRLEFGFERVLSNDANLEATAFFDTTAGRGVGLLRTPISGFSGSSGDAFINVANQEGAARGMRRFTPGSSVGGGVLQPVTQLARASDWHRLPHRTKCLPTHSFKQPRCN